jgi:hypothetical protein
MIYSLICSRTSKCLSLRELIHAFCIIIIAIYMISFHYYFPSFIIIYALVVDLWDFPTKSPLLGFNSWEVENLIFSILFISGLSRSLKIEEKIPHQFLTRWRTVSERSTRREPQGPNNTRWHALQVWVRHPVPFMPRASSWTPFIPDAPFHPKT